MRPEPRVHDWGGHDGESRWRGCGSDGGRNFVVVPAKAGTHNHRDTLFDSLGPQPSQNYSCGYGSRIALAGRSLVRDDNGICRHDFKQPKAFPRHCLPESCQSLCPSPKKGRRESRALTAPAAWGATKTSPPVSPPRVQPVTPASPRNGLTVCFVLSPVSGVYCHRCRTRYETGWIDATVAAPGPHDFAVRCERSRPASKPA